MSRNNGKQPITLADIVELAGTQSLIVVDLDGNVVIDSITLSKGWKKVGACEVLSIMPAIKFKRGVPFEVLTQLTVDWEKFRESVDWGDLVA